jgi:hypothetical protein
MRYTTPTKHSCRTSFSRVGLRGFLLTAGILSLLIWSLGSSAGTSSRSTSSTPKSDAKTAPAEPKAKLEPIAMMAPFFKASGNLDQVRNGTATAPIDPPDWVNGNAGASNAHYREGESIPYRLNLTGLSLGSHTVIIEWDTRHSSVNAIDYITYYDRIGETVQPLLGLAGSYGNPTLIQIPTPGLTNGATVATNSFLALPAGDQKFTSYNATGVNLSYANEDVLTSAAQTASSLQITFNATASNVLFAWGGHIASSGDWGVGNSAAGISGSPYHTRLISLDGAGGNQDRSLSAAAVLPPLGCSLVSDSLDVCAGGSNTHTSTAVVGQTYSFSLVNNGGNASITSSDTDPAGGTVSAQVTTSGAGSYTITLTTTTAGGTQTCPATVTVHAPPAADAGAASYEHCQTDGLAFAMSAATSTVPTGGTRTWTVSPANAASISDAGAANPTITLNSVGTVTAILTVTGPFCTTASDSSTLTVSGTATAAAGPDQTVCASSPAVTLAGSTSGSATSASWSGGGGSFNPNNSTLNAVYTPSAAEVTAGSATLTLTTNDPAGSCGAGTDTITITINPNPTVEISLADACAGTAHLHATASGGTGPYIYSWKKNNVAVVQANSADLTLSGPGSYSVSVTDNSSTTCGSAPDTFVVCYTEGAVASTSPQGPSNSLNAAIKPKSDTSTFLARLTTFVVSTFATSIF